MSKNSLSTLIGNYMSDSENDEDECKSEKIQSNSFSKEVHSLMNEIEPVQKRPSTEWTKCMDNKTGHPYYWNISTKEVTWEKPLEYEKYLDEIAKIPNKMSDDCWTKGYSEGSNTPYYVNEFTREVSWEKPVNFKEKPKELNKINSKKNFNKTLQKSEKKQEKLEKKKIPKHLEPESDEEIKIELINSYTTKSESSSDEEKKSNEREELILKPKTQKLSKPKLVPAYNTDDEAESDTENDTSVKDSKALLNSKPSLIENTNTINSTPPRILTPSPTSSIDIPQPTSFASIITGGKPESCFDDEINKLKEELEKDFASTQSQEPNTDETDTVAEKVVENSFDEKTFKRKRRIEFGTNKPIQLAEDPEQDGSKSGFGFTDLASNENSKDGTDKVAPKNNLYTNFQRSHVAFVKKENEEKPNIESKTEEENSKLKINITDLSDVILGKVKFLSACHSEVSTVQAMNIQLETLLTAFKASSLDSEYFYKWLKQTSDDLVSLEKNAAPDGWKCKWDRASAQYCYENLSSGKIQWEFPGAEKKEPVSKDDEEVQKLLENKKPIIKSNTDEVQGEDEMDICTTPPPNQHEKIIFQQNLPPDGSWDADNAPPPPIISTPSPPCINPSVVINNELSAFYSDIARLSTLPPMSDEILNTPTPPAAEVEAGGSQQKRPADAEQTKQKRKRKRRKVQGLSMGNKDVTTMVAKWQNAQKEKAYNFW